MTGLTGNPPTAFSNVCRSRLGSRDDDKLGMVLSAVGTIPVVGGVPLASAAAFDLGVFLVVVGATMVMLLSIARLSRTGEGH